MQHNTMHAAYSLANSDVHRPTLFPFQVTQDLDSDFEDLTTSLSIKVADFQSEIHGESENGNNTHRSLCSLIQSIRQHIDTVPSEPRQLSC